MKTKRWAITLIIFNTLLTSTAQIFLKKGANNLTLNILSLFTNIPLIIGIAMYAIAAIIVIIALKGGELSVLYPLIATSFIWVNILSGIFFSEKIGLLKWLGIIFIIGGVSFVGMGSKK